MTEVKTGTVYVLIDPRDNCVRYVGATKQTLKARLNGHMNSPTPRIKAWVTEVVSAGMVPQIEPIQENVPEDDLWDLERAEITRRFIAGERILNESGTAAGRRYLEEQEDLARAERNRAAWERVANQIRDALGGPLAPGDLPPVQLDDRAADAYRAFMAARDELDQWTGSGPETYYKLRSRAEDRESQAEKALWHSVRGTWSPLLRRVYDMFSDVLESQVKPFVTEDLDSKETSRCLTLLPWRLVAVTPWAAIASPAGIDVSGHAFADWATDDPVVREALELLQTQPYERWRRISILSYYDINREISFGMVAMGAAYIPGFELPGELRSGVRSVLESALQGRQLTPAMADLLLKLNPNALNGTLGPDLAARADARLGLQPGTSRDVLVAVLEASDAPYKPDRLDRIVSRARAELPTVPTPVFSEWYGNTAPIFQAITASLAAAGLLAATPEGKTPAELVDETRSLWSTNPDSLEEAA